MDDSSVDFSNKKGNSSESEISSVGRRRNTTINMEQYAIDGDGRYQVIDDDLPQQSTFKKRRAAGGASSLGHN